MSDTNSPAPQATSAAQWKQTSGVGAPLRVPSGNTCLVRPMSMQALIRNNMIPNELMSIVTSAMKSRKAPTMGEMTDDLDTDKMVAIMQCMDDVVQFMVVEPQIHSTPGQGESRDPNILYIDEVDQEDKTFIFQYAVGGTRDIDKFREGLAGYVGDLEEEQGMADTTS